jgi:hypothetical protein
MRNGSQLNNTERQILRLLYAGLCSDAGLPPTTKEFCEMIHRSRSCVNYAIGNLACGGLIVTVPREPRMTRLTDAGLRLVRSWGAACLTTSFARRRGADRQRA